MKSKALGFYFTLVAGVLSLISLFLYIGVMYKLPVVFVFCAVAVVLTVLALVGAVTGKKIPLADYIPVANAVLMACAGVWAFYLMVNQLGYVVAKLDEPSTIIGLIIFEVVAIISMILNIVASFLKQDK